MCTPFCVCPYASPQDKHYKEYSKVPTAKYDEFNRTFIPPLDEIVVQIYDAVVQSKNITEL